MTSARRLHFGHQQKHPFRIMQQIVFSIASSFNMPCLSVPELCWLRSYSTSCGSVAAVAVRRVDRHGGETQGSICQHHHQDQWSISRPGRIGEGNSHCLSNTLGSHV